MLEIDVTNLMERLEDLPLRWRDCREYSEIHPPLSKQSDIQEAKDYFLNAGLHADDVDAWDDLETQAIVIQNAVSVIRSNGRFMPFVQTKSFDDHVSDGELYQKEDGRWYVSMVH